jgi:ribulose-phosphate 3-epimerase
VSFLTNLPPDRLLVDVSMWSASLGALAADIERMAPYADLFHFDASDCHFVAEPLFFPALVGALRPLTAVPFHIHLMARSPARLAGAFAAAGADLITVHAEADDVAAALAQIRAGGQAAGLALTLDTAPEAAARFLDAVDAVVMVGTPLGTRGTRMDPRAPDRMAVIRQMLAGRGHIPVLADGGIRHATVPGLAAAGASGVVAGSLLLASPEPSAVTAWLHAQHPAPGRGGGR